MGNVRSVTRLDDESSSRSVCCFADKWTVAAQDQWMDIQFQVQADELRFVQLFIIIDAL